MKFTPTFIDEQSVIQQLFYHNSLDALSKVQLRTIIIISEQI